MRYSSLYIRNKVSSVAPYTNTIDLYYDHLRIRDNTYLTDFVVPAFRTPHVYGHYLRVNKQLDHKKVK